MNASVLHYWSIVDNIIIITEISSRFQFVNVLDVCNGKQVPERLIVSDSQLDRGMCCLEVKKNPVE